MFPMPLFVPPLTNKKNIWYARTEKEDVQNFRREVLRTSEIAKRMTQK
jgi:hypothetical protein